LQNTQTPYPGGNVGDGTPSTFNICLSVSEYGQISLGSTGTTVGWAVAYRGLFAAQASRLWLREAVSKMLCSGDRPPKIFWKNFKH